MSATLESIRVTFARRTAAPYRLTTTSNQGAAHDSSH